MSYQLDHRQLADEMEIFCLDEEIGAGLPLWLPNGVVIRDQLEEFVKELERRQGYQRVASPHLARESLYRKSGHLSSFGENMFPPMQVEGSEQRYYLRPMNCPHHHQIFKARPRSYRHLPLRLAEYGHVYRLEPSGSLKGLVRARGLCQNDAPAHDFTERPRSEEDVVLQLHPCTIASGRTTVP